MLNVSSISKSYKKELVLNNISFNISSGETTCIIGQNGSGKSTLLSILAGILKPDSGTITINGAKLKEGKGIGFVPQKDYLFEDLKVKDNIKFWAAAADLSFSSKQVKDYIELFNVGSFLNKKVSKLSGGMKKRAALCTALLHNPDILLLDEPFSGLDLIHKEEVCIYLSRLRTENKTIIYSSHNAEEIHLMATRILAIFNGQIYNVPMSDSLDKTSSEVTKILKRSF